MRKTNLVYRIKPFRRVINLNDNRHKKMPTGGHFYATFLILYLMKLVPFKPTSILITVLKKHFGLA